MKKMTLCFIILLCLGCQQEQKPDVQDIFAVDIQFSETSGKKGFSKAFMEFAHENAVILRENSMPIVGKPELLKIFEKSASEDIILTWEPMDGDIAKSGELGYTYGIYTIKADTIVEKGTYVSIWKKNENGNWKYVLDTGNKGLGE